VAKRHVVSTGVSIPGPLGVLEGALDASVDSAAAVAVICHPHPQQQGTMQNKVVTTVARAFTRLGATAVRFNFRGVGGSAGAYAGGEGERDDALAVVAWCRGRWPGGRLYLGGFSFGAAVALAVASRVAPAGLVTVAPPIDRLPTDFVPPDCPWLLVHGSADDVVPADAVVAWGTALTSRPRVVLLDGVGHFFHGSLVVLGDSVADFFASDIAPLV